MYQYKAKCVNVVDGDTIDFELDLGFHIKKVVRIRLEDIDCPELRGEDKEFGKEVKRFVFGCLYNQSDYPIEVQVTTGKDTSFDRWMGTVHFSTGQTLQSKIKEAFPEIK